MDVKSMRFQKNVDELKKQLGTEKLIFHKLFKSKKFKNNLINHFIE